MANKVILPIQIEVIGGRAAEQQLGKLKKELDGTAPVATKASEALKTLTKEYNDLIVKAKNAGTNSLAGKEFLKQADSVKGFIKGIGGIGPALEQNAPAIQKAAISMRGLSKEINNLLIQARSVGTNTLQGQEFIKQAAVIKDELADLRAASTAYASDTAKLDAAIQVVSSIGSAYQIAQGASALFGKENEDLQKTFVKLQAVMALTTGLQQLQNALQKESALSTQILIPLQKAWTAATASTSAAMTRLKAALIATGIGALVVLVGTLIANWKELVKWIETSFPALETVTKYFKNFQQIASGAIAVVIEYFKILGEVMVNVWTGKFSEAIDLIKGASERLAKAANDAYDKKDRELKIQASLKSRELQIQLLEAQGKDVLRMKLKLAQDELSILEKTDEEYNAKLVEVEKLKTEIKLQGIEDRKKANEKALEAEIKAFEDTIKAIETGAAFAKAAISKEFTGVDAKLLDTEAEKDKLEQLAKAYKDAGKTSSIEYSNILKGLSDLNNQLLAEAETKTEAFKRASLGIKTTSDKQVVELEFISDKTALENITQDQIRYSNLSAEQRLEVEKKLASDIEQLERDKQRRLLDIELASLAAKYELDKAAAIKNQEDLKILEYQYQVDTTDIEIKQAQLASEELVAIAKKKNDEITELDKKAQAERDLILGTAKTSALTLAQNLADAYVQIQRNRDKALQDELTKNLEDEKNKKLKNTRLTESQRANIEEEYNKKAFELRLRFWKSEQQAAKTQALINGALGVTNAFATSSNIYAGVILAALVVAQTALQIKVIDSQPPPTYATGTKYVYGRGNGTSDNVNARLSVGEAVITAEKNKAFKPVINAIHDGLISPEILNSFVLNYKGITLPKTPTYDKRLAKEIAIELSEVLETNEYRRRGKR